MGDLYYVPRVKTTEYSRLARMFQRNKVFLEIAVPTIASLIDFPAYPVNITGKSTARQNDCLIALQAFTIGAIWVVGIKQGRGVPFT